MSIEKKPAPSNLPESQSLTELAGQAGGATNWSQRISRGPAPFSEPARAASAPVAETIPLTITHEQMREKNREHHPDFNHNHKGSTSTPSTVEEK